MKYMSLGLVVASDDKRRIYLAIESEGVQCDVLDSKLIRLQTHPEMVLLVTGGLEHWRDVRNDFTAQPTIHKASDEIVSLLNKHTKSNNQAFGLLCGFDDGSPVCYRINRSL